MLLIECSGPAPIAQDYRPGMAFSDLEPEPPRRRPAAEDAARPALPLDDGSGGFGRGGGGGARGLGYGAGGEKGDDVFESYRRMRSSGYHEGTASWRSKSRK